MTLEELVGLQLVVGIPGTQATSEVIEHFRAIHAVSCIPFRRNFESPEQFCHLVRDLEQGIGHPLLVMVDHEGGNVVRYTSGVTRFPDALTQGRTQSPEAIRAQGEIEAKELRALNTHVNLAPCVDILTEGADPIIGTRSYGPDPDRVAALGAARITGLQSGGVAACAKHFPGIGAVPKDPHQHLPSVDVDWQAMRTRHLIPFRRAIEAGVATVMSSHVCYPTLFPDQPTTPATFLAPVIRGLLREALGFEGVIFTDDLEMGALRDLGSLGEAAVRAVAAGHDMVLVCSDRGVQREVFDALCEAYRKSRLLSSALEASVARIESLRKNFLPQP